MVTPESEGEVQGTKLERPAPRGLPESPLHGRDWNPLFKVRNHLHARVSGLPDSLDSDRSATLDSVN